MLNRSEKYTLYFQSLIGELREQHNCISTRRVDGRHFHPFDSGHRISSYYVVGFHKQGARDSRDRQAFTMLGLWHHNSETNKAIFDALEERKSEIEAQFGIRLEWKRRDDIKRSYIGLWREGHIDDDERALETIKAWHIKNLLKLKEVFTLEIQRALDRL